MELTTAIEYVKLVIATKNEKNEIRLLDELKFRIAITVMSNNLSVEQMKDLLN